jgi:hypothetical protein
MDKTISKQQFSKQGQIVRDIEHVFMDALRKTQNLISSTEWGYDDIRISLFGKLSGILNSAVVSLYFLQNHLTPINWWQATYNERLRIFEPSIPETISCFDGQAKTALHLGLTSNAESAFRIIVRALDPAACGRGDAAFASIYDRLLRKTGQLSDKPIYDLLRHIRNTKLHSDGVFRPENAKNAQVEYRQETFYFEVNKPFIGFTWKLVTTLAQDNRDSMLRIVKSPVVTARLKILDPQKIR